MGALLTNPLSFCFLTYNSITALAPPPLHTQLSFQKRGGGGVEKK